MIVSGIEPLRCCFSHTCIALKSVSASAKLVFHNHVNHNDHIFLLACSYKLIAFLDMWAMGAIMAELITLRPLFPGTRYVIVPFSSLMFHFFCYLNKQEMYLVVNNIVIFMMIAKVHAEIWFIKCFGGRIFLFKWLIYCIEWWLYVIFGNLFCYKRWDSGIG